MRLTEDQRAKDKHTKNQHIIDIKRIDTPLGAMFACALAEGICLLEFADREVLDARLQSLSKQFDAGIIPGNNGHFDRLECELDAYFNGSLREFTVPLYPSGTAFQKAAWDALLHIPYGESISYKQQAELVGKPKAIRAVANANGMNRMSILIPCHRVIGANGQLAGYGGGVWRKKHLLELEAGQL